MPNSQVLLILGLLAPEKSIEALKKRLTKTAAAVSFRFPINDDKVYTKLSDFKTKQGKEMFIELSELYKKQEKLIQLLEEKRLAYHKGRYNEANTIRSLEKSAEELHAKVHTIEKAIRNSENR